MTGLLYTSVSGTKFWHGCDDPEKGFKEMKSVSWQYGSGWGKPGSKLEFCRIDGTGYELIQEIQTGW